LICAGPGGHINTENLIFQAIEEVDKEPFRKGKTVFSVVKSKLAVALMEIIEDLTIDLQTRDFYIGNVDGAKGIDMLLRHLLADAIQTIDPLSVAEALLIRAAKQGVRPNSPKNDIASTRLRPRQLSK